MKKFTLSGFADFFSFKDLSFETTGESSFKLDFSKENLKEKSYSNQSRSRGISSLIILFVLFLFSNFLTAQTPVIKIDGLTTSPAGEWNQAGITHLQDLFGNGVREDQFATGTKDFFFATAMDWSLSQTKGKTDLANGAGAILPAGNVLLADGSPALGGPFLVFAGDRTVNNGDAQIGFWFFQDGTAPVTVAGKNYFDPPKHKAPVVGDILVLADFTGGGRSGAVTVLEWVGTGGTYPNSNNVFNLVTFNAAVAENNAGVTPVPNGWLFPTVSYDNNEFYEGYVDLASFGAASVCFSRFMLEARSSQSITAELDDFVGGSLGGIPTTPTPGTVARCGSGSVNLTASGCTDGTLKWYATATSTEVLGTGSTFTTPSISQTTSYFVSCTNVTRCESARAEVIATINPIPTVSVNSPAVSCAGGSATVTATPSPAGTYTYAWTVPQGVTIPANTVASFSASVAGTYSVIVTTQAGCPSSSGSGIVNVPTAVSCSIQSTNPKCFGGSDGSLTASGSGGTGAYTYSLNGGTFQSSGTFTGLVANVLYTVTTKDANACTSTCSVTLTQPTAVDLTAQGTTFCYGEKGSITFSAIGGTGTITYTVNGNTSTSPFEVTTGGDYVIVATDENGCKDTKQVKVTVNPLPTITCIDPASTTVLCGVTKVKSQENTDSEFLSWLNTFTYNNNNNNTLYTVGITYEYDSITNTVKSDNGDGPKNPAIGTNAKVTVTWTLTDKETGCKNSCSSTFTIANGCIPTCSFTKTNVKCQGTGTGSIKVTVSGGALPYTINLFKDGNPVALDSKTGTVEPYTITFDNLFSGSYSYLVTDSNQSMCNNNEPIDLGGGTPCGANCTYTQGYYGNEGGTSCANGVSYSTKGLIAKALSSYPLGTMTIGLPGRCVKMSNNTTDIAKIIEVLPGGGSSVVLSTGNFLITAMPASYLKKGNINNTLLAQTITLGLNLGIDNTLGTFALQSGTLAIASPQGGCGSSIPMVRSCSYDIYTPTINEYKYYNIPALVGLLPTPTVQGLFDMANNALGGGTLPAGITLTNLASAVDLINNVFDECRISMGYNQTPLTCIADRAAFDVSPVPIIDYATVIYQFSYASSVTIEVRNNLGVLLFTYVDPTPSYLGKVVSLPYLFGVNGNYFIKVITNIGSTTKQVTH